MKKRDAYIRSVKNNKHRNSLSVDEYLDEDRDDIRDMLEREAETDRYIEYAEENAQENWYTERNVEEEGN